MKHITLKRLCVAYAVFIGAVFLFEKFASPLSHQGLQAGLMLVRIFNFIFFSLALFQATLWAAGHLNRLAARNRNRNGFPLELVSRFNTLFCLSSFALFWIELLFSHLHFIFRQ